MAALSASHVTVTTTATLAATWTRTDHSFTVRFRNVDTKDVYVGGTSAVVSNTGYLVSAGETLTIAVPPGAGEIEELWAVLPSGSAAATTFVDPS